MINFLKIIRFQNLLIIILTMSLMRYSVVYPFLDNMPIMKGLDANIYRLSLQFPFYQFCLLVLSVILIAAAGYIINDFFDFPIDKLNKPEKIIIDVKISWSVLKIVYYIFNILGNLIGIYLAYSIKIWQLGFIFPLFTGLLYYYSLSYKRHFLTGNILVALSIAAVPLITSLFELVPVMIFYKDLINEYHVEFYTILQWALGFAFFAFITNLIREIIKDIQDKEGDKAYGANTIPIALAEKGAKYVISALILFEISVVFYIYFNYLKNPLSLVFLLFLVTLLTSLLVMVILSKDKKGLYFAGFFTKLIMIYGLLYSLIVYYQYNQLDLSKLGN